MATGPICKKTGKWHADIKNSEPDALFCTHCGISLQSTDTSTVVPKNQVIDLTESPKNPPFNRQPDLQPEDALQNRQLRSVPGGLYKPLSAPKFEQDRKEVTSLTQAYNIAKQSRNASIQATAKAKQDLMVQISLTLYMAESSTKRCGPVDVVCYSQIHQHGTFAPHKIERDRKYLNHALLIKDLFAEWNIKEPKKSMDWRFVYHVQKTPSPNVTELGMNVNEPITIRHLISQYNMTQSKEPYHFILFANFPVLPDQIMSGKSKKASLKKGKGKKPNRVEMEEEEASIASKKQESGVQSRRFQAKQSGYESSDSVSIGEELIMEELVMEEPAKEEPVKEELVKEELVKEELVKEEPVKEEPAKEESGAKGQRTSRRMPSRPLTMSLRGSGSRKRSHTNVSASSTDGDRPVQTRGFDLGFDLDQRLITDCDEGLDMIEVVDL